MLLKGKFSAAVLKFSLQHCQSDHSVFSHTSKSRKILLIVYVGDILITSDDKKAVDDLKTYLQTSFQTKDLGKLPYFLGIEVARSKEGINLSQRRYQFITKKVCVGYSERNWLVRI